MFMNQMNFCKNECYFFFFIFNIYLFHWYLLQTNIAESMHLIQLMFAKKTTFWATEIVDQISVLHYLYRVSMATKDSIMKQSMFFWVIGHRLIFEYSLKKFLLGAWRELILISSSIQVPTSMRAEHFLYFNNSRI